MHRFFVNQISDNHTIIQGEDYFHIVTVLRLKKNDEIIVFNYEHGEFIARIMDINKNGKIINLEIIKKTKEREIPGIRIIAIIALIKNEKMDFVLEKLTEIGIDKIIPVMTKRSVVKIKDPEKRKARWEKIIYSAVKQSGRITKPEILPVTLSIFDLYRNIEDNSIKFLIWEKEEKKYLIDEINKIKEMNSIYFFIGPEGGFEDSETAELIHNGFIPVSLGDTTLRAETAAIISAGIILQTVRRGKWKN